MDPARALAALDGLAFVLASILLGIRLLALAARTRQLPELCFGLTLLLMGVSKLAWSRLRRRLRLGLADAVVTERVLLWAIASLSSVIVSTTSTIAGFLGINFAATAFGAAVTALLGLISAGAMWLAFLPPAGYLRRVRARAPAALAAVPG
ncbi:MAG: hypothetical protein ACHQ3O_11900 [Candidatus Limnocylindria bacterium]